MNKRGQALSGLGMILMMFVAVIVGVALFIVIAQTVGDSTTTELVTNYNLTTGGVAGGTITITDYKFISGVTIMNTTGESLRNAANYSVANNQVVDGSLVVVITIASDLTNPVDAIWTLNATVAHRPDYIDDSAARSIAGLIAIFFALAIAVVTIEPSLRNEFLDMVRK